MSNSRAVPATDAVSREPAEKAQGKQSAENTENSESVERAGSVESANENSQQNPQALDIFALARAAGHAEGTLALSQLSRMVTEVPADAPGEAHAMRFSWSATGYMQGRDDASGRAVQTPHLHLQVEGAVWLDCQRCLAPFEQPLAVDAHYRIVASEAALGQIDPEDEVDAIVGSRRFDLVDLIDEEIALAVPMVPKHEICPVVHESLASGADGADAVDLEQIDALEARLREQADAARQRPFAALAGLAGADDATANGAGEADGTGNPGHSAKPVNPRKH